MSPPRCLQVAPKVSPEAPKGPQVSPRVLVEGVKNIVFYGCSETLDLIVKNIVFLHQHGGPRASRGSAGEQVELWGLGFEKVTCWWLCSLGKEKEFRTSNAPVAQIHWTPAIDPLDPSTAGIQWIY